MRLRQGRGSGPLDVDQIRDELLAQLRDLRQEVEVVYAALVLPHWGDTELHGFPRTLYGYVMSSFSFVDLLSHYRYPGERQQTNRMRKFLSAYTGARPDAAAVAVQMWRHTLMHTANPQPVLEKGTGKVYGWLLHWREHLPRDQHMRFQQPGREVVLTVGLSYFWAELGWGAERLFEEAGCTPRLRDQIAQRIRSCLPSNASRWTCRPIADQSAGPIHVVAGSMEACWKRQTAAGGETANPRLGREAAICSSFATKGSRPKQAADPW